MALQKSRCTNVKCFYYYHDIKTQISNNQCPLCGVAIESKMYWGSDRRVNYDSNDALRGNFVMQAFGIYSKRSDVVIDMFDTLIDEFGDLDVSIGMRKMLAAKLVPAGNYAKAYETLKPLFSKLNPDTLSSLEEDQTVSLYEMALMALGKMDELSSLEDQMIPYCKKRYGEKDSVTLEHLSMKFISVVKTSSKEETKEKVKEIIEYSEKATGKLGTFTTTVIESYKEAQKNTGKSFDAVPESSISLNERNDEQYISENAGVKELDSVEQEEQMITASVLQSDLLSLFSVIRARLSDNQTYSYKNVLEKTVDKSGLGNIVQYTIENDNFLTNNVKNDNSSYIEWLKEQIAVEESTGNNSDVLTDLELNLTKSLVEVEEYETALKYTKTLLDSSCRTEGEQIRVLLLHIEALHGLKRDEEALKYVELAVVLANSLYGENSIQSFEIRIKHAEILLNVNTEKSMEIYSKLILEEETMLELSPSIVTRLSNSYASALRAQKQYKKAIDSQLILLEKLKQLSPNSEELISIYRSIGKAYIHQKKYNGAFEMRRLAIKIMNSVYGENHPETIKASVACALTLFYGTSDRLAGLDGIRLAYEKAEKFIGKESEIYFFITLFFTVALFDAKKDKTLASFEEKLRKPGSKFENSPNIILDLREELRNLSMDIYGPEDLITLKVSSNYACELLYDNNTEKGMPLSMGIINQYLKLTGPYHSEIDHLVDAISHAMQRMSYYELALKANEILLTIREKMLSKEDRNILEALFGIDNALVKLDNDSYLRSNRNRIIEYFVNDLKRAQSINGQYSTEAICAMQTIANTYKYFNMPKEAHQAEDKLFKAHYEIIAIKEKEHGKNCDESLKERMALANTYRKYDRMKETIKLKEYVLREQEKNLGIAQNDTFLTMRDLACDLGMIGQKEQKLKLAKEYYYSVAKEPGDKLKLVKDSLDFVCRTLEENGQYDECMRRSITLLKISVAIQGERNVTFDKFRIGELSKKLGMTDPRFKTISLMALSSDEIESILGEYNIRELR